MDKRHSCFIIMPYSEKSDKVFHDAIAPVLQSLQGHNILPLRADTMGRSDITLKAHVENAVKSADFCIADVTGGNLNVVYELGFANAIGKPVILIGEVGSHKTLLSNLKGQLIFEYDMNRLSEFRRRLAEQCRLFLDTSILSTIDTKISSKSSTASIFTVFDEAFINKLVAACQKRFLAAVGSPGFLINRIMPLILSRGISGIEIKVICANPEGDFVRIRSADSSIPVSQYRMQLWQQIDKLYHLLNEFKGGHTALYLTDSIVSSSLYISDDIALVMPYISSGRSREAIGISLSRNLNPIAYSLYTEEFERKLVIGKRVIEKMGRYVNE